jgi:hypothetical protein
MQMNSRAVTPSPELSSDINQHRTQFIKTLYSEYPKLIYAAATRGMFGSTAEDLAIEPSDHLQELALHLWLHPEKLDALMRKGTAKTSTRLFALAKSRTRAHRTKTTRRRSLAIQHKVQMADRKLALGDVPEQFLPNPRFGGCEFASTREEVAATKAGWQPDREQMGA